jgi:hypothetical protein
MGVYKDMISYYTPLLGPLKVHGRAKYKPVSWRFYFICSFFGAVAVFLRLDFLGLQLEWIVTVGFYNYGLVDWKCCVIHKAIIARNKGIWMNTKSTE